MRHARACVHHTYTRARARVHARVRIRTHTRAKGNTRAHIHAHAHPQTNMNIQGVGSRGHVCGRVIYRSDTYISVAAIDYFTHVELAPLSPRPARAPHSRRRDASYRARYRRYIAALALLYPSSRPQRRVPTPGVEKLPPRTVKFWH